MKRSLLALLSAVLLLSACDQVGQRLGLDNPAKKEARQDAEGRAVGSACRQSGRAIEDCYSIYYWLPKASIFAGWRDMNDYMLSNKLEVVQPRYEPPSSPDEARKKRQKQPEEGGAAPGEGDKAEAKPAAAPAATEKSSGKTEGSTKDASKP